MRDGVELAAILAACLAVLPGAPAQPAVPVISAAEVSTPPKIDGVLDDECWRGRDKITGFKEVAHGRDAGEPTEVMICRDKDCLYVAFICRDSQPALIHAAQTQRNSDLTTDDFVTVLLDTLHTHINYYAFSVNARGAQDQSVPEGGVGNITWRGDWYAASKMTEAGWCAEIAIPFRWLRYPKRAGSFAVLFHRYIPRLDEQSYWPHLGQTFDQTRFADLVGLDLPLQRTRPVVMPYTVTSTEPGRSFTDVGLDIKQELPNNVVGMMTYNPDFTDVQDAVASVGYSYTERWLPEKRPFFQEGAELFPDDQAFYSRRIGQIDAGLKTFGTVGRHSFGLMHAYNRGETNHFAASYGYDAGPDAGIKLYWTGSTVNQSAKTDPSEPDTSMCFSPGAYKRWRASSGITTLSARKYGSLNSGHPDASSVLVSLVREAAPKNLGCTIDYAETDADYYVRDAYVPLTGVKGFTSQFSFYDRPTTGRLTYWDVYLDANRRRAQAGGLHDETLGLGLDCFTKNEYALGAYFSDGSWLGLRDASALFRVDWLARRLYGGGFVKYVIGKRAGRNYVDSLIQQSLSISSKLVLSLNYERSVLGAPGPSETSTQLTALVNYELTPERSLGLWAVGRNSDTNLCFTYRQSVRKGSDVYLIYGYPNTLATEKRIALKIVTPLAL